MNFNSLIVGQSPTHVMTLIGRLISMHLNAGQRVIFLGSEDDQIYLKSLPALDHEQIICVNRPEKGEQSRLCPRFILELVDSLRPHCENGLAVYLNPGMPEFCNFHTEMMKRDGVTMHIAVPTIADLFYLGVGDSPDEFEFRALFVGEQDLTMFATRQFMGIESQVWGNRQSIAVIRFDNTLRFVDVDCPLSETPEKPFEQMQAALPYVRPLLDDNDIRGVYPVYQMLGALTRIYEQEAAHCEHYLCYDAQSGIAFQLAGLWRTACFQQDEFGYVALPEPLASWPFNCLGVVLGNASEAAWWCGLGVSEQITWGAL